MQNCHKHRYAVSQLAYLLDVRQVRHRGISIAVPCLPVLLTILKEYIMGKKIIVNADDFGLHTEINKGIIKGRRAAH